MTPPDAAAQPPVRIDIDGAIARLTLNRPEFGNAIDMAMARALADAAARCSSDATIRCVVLTGAGRLFCAGGDVRQFAAAGTDAPTFLGELAGMVHRAVSSLAAMPKPLLVLVNGPAAGAGFSLALLGDVVLAAPSAHFTAAYGAIGLTPDGGMSWLLPRVAGLRLAQEMILTNRQVAAPDAAALGLITRMVEDDQLETEGAAMATRLANAPTAAIGAARALLLGSFARDLDEHLALEARTIAAAAAGAESREGIAAFLARRRPDFSKA